MALRLTRSAADADDLIQESNLRAWKFWAQFTQGTNCRAWLLRIVKNTFINGYRKKRREMNLLAAVDLETRSAQYFSAPSARDEDGVSDEVAAALRGLSVDFRAVLTLVDLGQASYQEAAERLGCPIGTVMSRLHRARRSLKRQLSNYARAEGYVQAA